MKKKILFLFFFTNFLFLIQAQNEFAPLGTKWEYSIARGFFPPSYEVTSIEVTDTQTINGKKLRKLMSAGEKGCACFLEWIYEENGKVFQYVDGDSFLLYDFNAQKGDIVITEHKGCSSGNTNFLTTAYSIDSISTISTAWGVKKVQHIKKIGGVNSTYTGNWGWNAKIVEGIGCLNYLFPSYTLCDLSPECLRDFSVSSKDSTIHFSQQVCLIMPTDELSQSNFKIFPNPSNGFLNIENLGSVGTNSTWSLFDAYGHLIYQQILDDTKETIDLHLRQGIYFWKITKDKNASVQGRLIIVE